MIRRALGDLNKETMPAKFLNTRGAYQHGLRIQPERCSPDKPGKSDGLADFYAGSAGMLGGEVHSSAMCVGNKNPAIVCRSEKQIGSIWHDFRGRAFGLNFEQDCPKFGILTGAKGEVKTNSLIG